MKRLESISGPKIVLLGNSNLAFGIDSEDIEEAFDMPVVNMGLHGGLGNAFHERMAELNVQEGDIYIICHSTYCDGGSIGTEDLAWITVENHSEQWKLLRPNDYLTMFLSYSVYLKKCIPLWMNKIGNQTDEESPYSRGPFK